VPGALGAVIEMVILDVPFFATSLWLTQLFPVIFHCVLRQVPPLMTVVTTAEMLPPGSTVTLDAPLSVTDAIRSADTVTVTVT